MKQTADRNFLRTKSHFEVNEVNLPETERTALILLFSASHTAILHRVRLQRLEHIAGFESFANGHPFEAICELDKKIR